MIPRDSYYWKLLERLTTQDVVEFFAQVEGGGLCPICREELVAHTRMNRLPDGSVAQDRARPAISHKSIQTGPPATELFELPCFAAGCDACGYTADFSVAPILEWKATREHYE